MVMYGVDPFTHSLDIRVGMNGTMKDEPKNNYYSGTSERGYKFEYNLEWFRVVQLQCNTQSPGQQKVFGIYSLSLSSYGAMLGSRTHKQ